MRPEHFPGAFTAALAEERAEIAAIVANPEPPTFENTIVAMERVGLTLDRVQRMFGVARENVTTPEYQALEHEWQPKLSEAAVRVLQSGQVIGGPGAFVIESDQGRGFSVALRRKLVTEIAAAPPGQLRATAVRTASLARPAPWLP